MADLPIIRMKLPHELPPDLRFKCAICKERRTLDKWNNPVGYTSLIICSNCAGFWSNRVSFKQTSRSDRIIVQRLSAVINAFEWEIKNGNDRWKKGLKSFG